MDFESAADEVFAAPRSEFVATRDRLAREAREQGDADTARRLGALRKPTVAAWLVNLLARERPEALQRFLALGDSLRAGSQLHEFAARRRDLQQELLNEVDSLAREHQQTVGSGTFQQITNTLNRALADAEAAGSVRAGRLSSALEPSGDLSEQWLASASSQQRSTATKSGRSKGSGARSRSSSRKQSGDEQQRQREEQRRREQQALDQAQERLDRAEEEAEQAHRDVEERRRELDRAEKRRKQADKEVLAARSERDSAASEAHRR